MAVVALVPPVMPGRHLTLTALSFSSGLRFSVRGLLGQSERRHGPAKPPFPLVIPKVAETAQIVKKKIDLTSPAPLRRFIACPELARTVVSRLGSGGGPDLRKTLVLECEPGPGILTQTLLNAGAHVIALESSDSFVSNLECIKKKLDGQLEVVHCDFFHLDPMYLGLIKPPLMYSEVLFENLGILAVPWTADVLLKVVGIVPQKKERNLLWKLIYTLYERNSVFKYGRAELNLFVSEKQYKTLVAKPGDSRIYQPLSVVSQIACDIRLLHMEPWSSFLTNSKNDKLYVPKSVLLPNDHLCLVQLTPRKNLFTDNLTPSNSTIFIAMVKQCLVQTRTKLIDKLNLLCPESEKLLLSQLEIPKDITTGSLYPEQYKALFETIAQSNYFDQMWLYEDDYLEELRDIKRLK